MGFSGGDKSKSTTTPQIPPELRALYGQITDVAGSNVPAFKNLISGAMAGDKSIGERFVGPSSAPSYASTFKPLSAVYTPTFDIFRSVAGAFQPQADTFQSQAATFRPVANAYRPLSGTFQPTAKATSAPMMYKTQQAQQQIARRMPRGGAQDAAYAQAAMGGNVAAGQAQGEAAARDIATKMGLDQQDVTNLMMMLAQDEMTQQQLAGADATNRQTLAGQDATNRQALAMQDITTQQGLAQQDIMNKMALWAQDEQTQQQLAGKDIEVAGDTQKRQETVLQNIMNYYASIFGGFNPQAAIGNKQETKGGSNIGLPFANIAV